MGFISANRNQMSLFGYSLDDFVRPDARCRFVAAIVGELDLSDLYADYSPQGGDAYDPATLLATWFFAYSEGVSSTRRLESLCVRDMHYIYVSANLHPDHTTLSRFRQRHSERLSDYFVQMLRLAAQRNVSDFRRIMTDGSKIEAACSPRRSRDAKGLERTLSDRQIQLEARKRTLQPKDRSKHRINLVEPEARNMNQVNGKPAAPAYNAQVSVDAQTQLIVAADLSDAPNDRNEFCRQHAQVEKNLGTDADRQYTADAGYHSLEQLEYVERLKVDAVIADPRPETRATMETQQGASQTQGAFTRRDFPYHKETDEYECPAGRRLAYWYTEKKRGRRIRNYRPDESGCAGCALRGRCMKGCDPDSDRTITRDEAEDLAEAMCRRAAGPQGRHRLKQRAMTVEPAIGNLKANLGFRRFHLRGKTKAAGEFLLMCIGHNLGKLHTLMGGCRRAAAGVSVALESALSFVARCLKSRRHAIPLFSRAA